MACTVKGCFVAMVTLMLASGFTNAECPANDGIGSIMRSLSDCTPNAWKALVEGLTLSNGFGILGAICKSGGVKDVFHCIKGLYKDCPSNADTVMWMFDLDRLEGVAEYTCSKLPVLINNWRCITIAPVKFWPCIKKSYNNYRKEVETTATAVCDFQAQLIKYSDDYYTQCGDDLAEMMRDVITQYMPVLCASCSLNPLTSVVMLLALIAIIFMKN